MKCEKVTLLGKIPSSFYLACSGGSDSMGAFHFFHRARKNFEVLFFHHGTLFSDESQKLVEQVCKEKKVPFHVGRLRGTYPSGESLEAFWREERLAFFRTFSTVLTAHHLDDQVETWVWSSLHGNPRTIPYRSWNIIHPFLLTPKKNLRSICIRAGIPFLEDPLNKDVSFVRARIRERMMGDILAINPGIYRTLMSITRSRFDKEHAVKKERTDEKAPPASG